MPQRGGNARTPLRTGLRVFALGGLAALVIVVASLVVLAPLTAGQQRAELVAGQDLAIQQQTAALRATLVRWQQFLEPRLDDYQAGASKFAPADIGLGSELTKGQLRQANRLAAMLRARGIGDQAGELEDAAQSLTNAIMALNPIASGVRLSPAQFARLVGAERAAYSRVWEVATSITDDVAQHTTAPDVRYAADRFRTARTLILILSGAIVLASLLFAAATARRAARRQREQEREAQRLVFGSDLQQALELAVSERAVYDVAGRALREAVPQLDVELLIADSSNARLPARVRQPRRRRPRRRLRRRVAARLPGRHPRAHDAVPVERGDQRVPVPARPAFRCVLRGLRPRQHRGRHRERVARHRSRRRAARAR